MVLLVMMEGDLEESAELDRDRRAGDRDFRRDDRTDWTLDERDRARLRGDTDRLKKRGKKPQLETGIIFLGDGCPF